jgi:hypothetical protein
MTHGQNAIWSICSSESRNCDTWHLDPLGTNGHWGIGKQPVAHPPVLDRLSRAQSRNGCALVIFAALSELPRRRCDSGAIFKGG